MAAVIEELLTKADLQELRIEIRGMKRDLLKGLILFMAVQVAAFAAVAEWLID